MAELELKKNHSRFYWKSRNERYLLQRRLRVRDRWTLVV